MQTDYLNLSNQINLIKTVRGSTKSLANALPLLAKEKETLQKQGLSSESIRLYEIARKYVGTPYGPVFPKSNFEIYHTDCVDLLWQYFFDAYQVSLARTMPGIKFDRNDKIYHHLTQKVTTLKYWDSLTDLEKKLAHIQTGDIAFHGHPSKAGAGGVSIQHAFIIGQPIFDEQQKVRDFTIINPRGRYSKDRENYSGQVIEGGRKDLPSNLQGLSLLETLNDPRLWRQNNRPHRQEIYVGRPRPKN